MKRRTYLGLVGSGVCVSGVSAVTWKSVATNTLDWQTVTQTAVEVRHMASFGDEPREGTPLYQLRNPSGGVTCADYSVQMKKMLDDGPGIPAEEREAVFRIRHTLFEGGHISHTLPEVRVDDGWRLVDPTFGCYYTLDDAVLSFEEIIRTVRQGPGSVIDISIEPLDDRAMERVRAYHVDPRGAFLNPLPMRETYKNPLPYMETDFAEGVAGAYLAVFHGTENPVTITRTDGSQVELTPAVEEYYLKRESAPTLSRAHAFDNGWRLTSLPETATLYRLPRQSTENVR